MCSSRSNSRRKPPWLKVPVPADPSFFQVSHLLKEKDLHTICQSARCPNITECWTKKTATFLILGDICTRSCAFCSVKKGIPLAVPHDEAAHITQAALAMGLHYAVITSVTRDDLEDGGSSHFAAVIQSLKQTDLKMKVEVLVPDFNGNSTALETVLENRPDVLNHNLEVPSRLYPKIKRSRSNYRRSLEILEKSSRSGFITKSGLMVGLGENEKDILQAFSDLQNVGCKFITIGQYLQPSRSNLPVDRYYSPEEFKSIETTAYDFGFSRVEAGPLVRSSYNAQDMYDSYIRSSG